ncbi:MAG: tripartite tricarboxylate transporter substrate binding protein [Betaproteobacteria bacterium]|nr:tripartite tricarboxylate transporter substrate binding protein [Betaproteobacteria bacterium]
MIVIRVLLAFVAFCVAFVAFSFAAATALAQPYPAKPIRIVVGFSPGGATDVFARVLAQGLQERLSQAVVVENRPGAGGNIANTFVARSAPDGYTLNLSQEGMLLAPWLMKAPTFDPLKDFVPIGIAVNMPQLLIASNNLPVKSVAELIAHAKANPGKLSYGTPGVASGHHLNFETLLTMTGTQMVHVPYKGAAPMMTDIISGNVHVALSAFSTTQPFMQKVRVLAVASRERIPQMKDLPTVAETLPGYFANVWFGLTAPATTAAEITRKLADEMRAAVLLPNIRKQLLDLGYQLNGTNSPAEMREFMATEYEKWGKIVKAVGIERE